MEIIDKIKFDFCYFSNEIYTETLEQNLTRKRESTAYTIYLEMNVKNKKKKRGQKLTRSVSSLAKIVLINSCTRF